MLDFWDDESILIDLLFESNLSIADISKELGWSEAKTSLKIKELGLTWVRRRERKLSRGHAALTQIIKKLLPGENVVNEFHIGERLMLDVYCPNYKLAAEYHGRQHFFFSNLFHKDYDDFVRSQNRDLKKIELCKENGIALVVFRYNDELTEEAVYNRMLDALQSTPNVEEPPNIKRKNTRSSLSVKGNVYYEEAKKRRREYEREMRKQIKAQRVYRGKIERDF